GGGASNSQYTFAGAGTVNMTGGAYTANVGRVNVATFNQTSGTFTMNPPSATLGACGIGWQAGRSVTYTMSGNAIINVNSGSAGGTNSFLAIGRGSGTNAYTNTLNVTGTANLNVGNNSSGRPGELVIAATADSNGTVNVTESSVVTVGGTAAGYTDNKIYFFKNGSNPGYTANLTQSGGTVNAVNGIQFGGTAGSYDGSSSANLTLTNGALYVGAQGITRGSGASTLPIAIKLQGGTIGASDNWSSSLDMKLGTTSGGPTFRAATSGGVSKNITLSGVLSDDTSVNGKLTKTGAGTLTLSGANTYTGATNINAGTLALGASNVLPDASAVSIGATTLDAATFADSAGTLDVTAANSAINLGSGATLAFANSSAVDWTGGTLNITGTFVPGTSLRFGTTSGGLTSTQLSSITSLGFSNFILDENGYLTTGDSTEPTLTSIVDNRGGGSITEGTTVTYTVTFSEAINPSTISDADFAKAGTAGGTIGTVTQVSATAFTVPVTNTTAGTLILQIPTTADIMDMANNSLICDPALDDDNIITVNTSPLPTLSASDIVDDKTGQPVAPNMMVTYTVTFIEDIDDTTVSSADFGNAGTSAITIGTIAETSPTSGVFTVQVTPTSTGTLQFSVNAGAVIKAAVSGNVLDTISDIVDADIITVGSYLFWDTGLSEGITSGDGAWNTTAGNTTWNNLTTNVIWSQTSATDASNGAVFGGADGVANEHVVTVGGTMAAESLTFSSSGYQITSGTVAVMPTTTTNGNITVAADKTATINSAISYANNNIANITANSGATLNLGGGASNSQYQFLGAGTINMTSGTYTANVGKVNAANLNQSGGTFNMNLPTAGDGHFIGFAAGRSVNYTMSGGAILNVNASGTTNVNSFLAIGRGAGNTAYSNTLNVTGAANLNVGNATGMAGELLIASDSASNGALNVTGGAVFVGSQKPDNKIYFFMAGSGAGYTASMTQFAGTVTANGIQFGGTAGTYNATSAANLTLSGSSAVLYVGAQGITRGFAADDLPVAIKLEGGTLGANQNWTSSLDMQLGATAGGVTIRAQDSTTNGRTIALSGNLSDVSGVNGALTKAGSSDLTLSGSNSYSGGTTVNAGRLFIGGANALPSAGAVTVNAGTLALNVSGTAAFDQGITLNTGSNLVMRQAATLSNVSLPTTGVVTFNQDGEATQPFSLGSNVGLTGNLNIQVGGGLGAPGNITLTGAISGTNTLTKGGSGTLMLAGSNTYTGATIVSAGTLDLGATDAASSSSSLTVNSGAGLALSSSSSTVPNLTFAGTGTLSFDAAAGCVLTVSDNNGVTNSGAAGSITINITGDAPANGTYTLVDYSGTLQGGGFNAYTLGSAPLGKSYALNNNSDTGAVELVVNSVYNWTGLNGSEWSTATIAGSKNWSKDGSAIDYANDLAVIFESTAANQIVNITGADVTPLSVLFNSGTYTLGGSFKIGGSAPVAVASGATLKLGSSDVLPDGAGAGTVTINGTLDLNGNSDTVNALTGSGSIDNTAAATTSTLTVGANTGGIFSGSLKNTGGTLALTKTGANDVILTGSNSYNGATTINQGRLFISSITAFSPDTAVTVNNGASFFLNASGTYAQGITLNSGANLAQRTAATLSNVTLPSSGTAILNNDDAATQAFTIANAQTLGGSLNIQVGGSGTVAPGAITLSGILSGPSGSLVKSGTGQLILRGANTFGGGVTIQNGTLESQATQFTLGTGTVTMGGAGSTGATYLTGQSNTNPFVINAPDSGNIVIGANGNGSGFTMSGGVTLNGNLTLQTYDNPNNGSTKAISILTGGVTGTGNLLLNNLGLAANTISLTTAAVNHTGTITLSGTAATGDTTISAPIGSNVTGITQSSTTSRLVLSGSNSYAGNLTINAGTVRISNNSNTANDVSTVTIATGGTLDLTYVGTDTVGKLFIGGVEQPAGVYGKSGSTDPSVTNTSAQITGDGTLTVPAPEIVVEDDSAANILNNGTKDFGSVEVGSNTELTFTVRNSGNAALNLTGTPLVAISGTNAADFTVIADPTTPVAAGGSTTFTVSFAPSAASARAATLTIANDDSDEGSFVISLSGTGTGTGQTAFAAWAGGATFNADANGDGVSNGLAWILGAADVSTNARSLLPTVSSSGTNMVVTFKRIQASINANTALTIELGTTLSAWPTTYTVGTDTAGSTSGVTIVKDSPSAGTDTVTLTVARGADAKKFVRLKAVLTP
ncbi:MAG: hypothetical protein B9S30_06565, partial [Verrucomicrobiia bacterium Tous-C5FEB]